MTGLTTINLKIPEYAALLPDYLQFSPRPFDLKDLISQ
jgi:hypothetical protein